MLLLVVGVTAVAGNLAVAGVFLSPGCNHFCWPPAIAGIPGVVDVPTIALVNAVADVPTVAGLDCPVSKL